MPLPPTRLFLLHKRQAIHNGKSSNNLKGPNERYFPAHPVLHSNKNRSKPIPNKILPLRKIP